MGFAIIAGAKVELIDSVKADKYAERQWWDNGRRKAAERAVDARQRMNTAYDSLRSMAGLKIALSLYVSSYS
jgi:hypothetical protein